MARLARAVEGIAAQSCRGAHQQDTVADRSPEVQQAHVGKRGRLRVAAADNDQRVSSHGRGVREPPWRRLAPAHDTGTKCTISTLTMLISHSHDSVPAARQQMLSLSEHHLLPPC